MVACRVVVGGGVQCSGHAVQSSSRRRRMRIGDKSSSLSSFIATSQQFDSTTIKSVHCDKNLKFKSNRRDEEDPSEGQYNHPPGDDGAAGKRGLGPGPDVPLVCQIKWNCSRSQFILITGNWATRSLNHNYYCWADILLHRHPPGRRRAATSSFPF